MLETHLLTPASGSALSDVEPLPTPLSALARQRGDTLTRTDSGMVAPAGFKAAKRRKTPRFIREESRRLRTPVSKPTRRPSYIDPELLEDPDADKLIAGVARLIFRLIVEGQQGCYQTGSFASVGVDPASEFNEEVFFARPRENWPRLQRACNCFRRREKPPLPEAIFRLLRDCLEAGHFSNGLVVVCAVYIERFVQLSQMRITEENWQQILLAALLLASKVFEDIHPWNVDYAAILWKAAGLRFRDRLSAYRLESKFLRCLHWGASVSGEVFANYYFALQNADEPPSPAHRHEYSNSLRRCSSWCGPAVLADIPESSEETQFKSSGHSPSITSSSSPLSAGSRSSQSPRIARTPPRHTPRPSLAQSPQVRSSVRIEEQLQERLDIETSDPQWRKLVASFPPSSNSGAEMQKSLSMEDLLWTDRRNPLIGTFRHAPHAEPPSRHINPRLSAKAKSSPQLAPATWPAVEGGDQGAARRQLLRPPSVNAAVDWARSISA